MITGAEEPPRGQRGEDPGPATAQRGRRRDRGTDHANRTNAAPTRARRPSRPPGNARGDEPHRQVIERLGWSRSQYTPSRRALVELLYRAGRPLGIDEILQAIDLPQSSVYRNLAVLERAGAVTRLPARGGHARYELSEVIVGHHHHLHLVCTGCGRMEDCDLPAALERQVNALLESLAVGERFRPDGHRLEVFGLGACCA
jgi:Fe2+ or Zn2+ uptake regulation protein